MNFFVLLPRWKVYLYTLIQRIKIYKNINSNKLLLGLDSNDTSTLLKMYKTYLPPKMKRKTRMFKIDALLKSVLVVNLHSATREEITICHKLLWLKHIKPKELIREMKELIPHGKEVGLSVAEMHEMDEDAIIREIIMRTTTSTTYSQEFTSWYENLPDEFFDDAETTTINDEKEDNDLSEVDELISHIKTCEKINQLREIYEDEDFGVYFEGKNLKKYKMKVKLQKEMIAILEKYKEKVQNEMDADEASVDKSNEQLASNLDDLGIDDETRNELIEVIESIEDENDLLELLSDESIEEFFQDKLEFDDDNNINFEKIKSQMLQLLGVTTDSSDEEENGNEEEDIDFSKMTIIKLRQYAKDLEIQIPAGSNKAAIIELLMNAINEDSVKESTEEEEMKITTSTVNEMIETNDRESLISLCEQLEIKLNAIQKKSAKIMGQKLLAVVPSDDYKDGKAESKKRRTLKATPKKTNSTPVNEKDEARSIYQLIEEMVLNGNSEDTIIKEVTPLYKTKGKSKLHVKMRVKQLVEIIKGDNDL